MWHVFWMWMRKKIRTLLFLCELSYQQHNNISGLAARKKNIWCERSQRNNKVLKFLVIQIQNTCRAHSVGTQLKLHLKIHLVLWPPCLRTICFSFNYVFMLCLFLCDLYTILMAIYYYFYCDSSLSWQFRLFSRLPPLRLLSRSFVVSPCVVSLAFMFILSHFRSLSQPLLMWFRPTIDFIKCF